MDDQDLFDTLIAQVGEAVTYTPRNVQTMIGPSGLGEECDRALVAALMELPRRAEPPNWRAAVGTAVHAYLERMLTDPRWICETRVQVGRIGGRPVFGSVDLYDYSTATVIDWKTKSHTQMSHHRRNGPGQKYIVQAQCYGVGMRATGLAVKRVMVIFLPRDGELHDAFFWSAPFDPYVAALAMERANRLYLLASTFGHQAVMAQFPPCHSEWCRTCADPNKIRPGATRVSSADNPFALAV